MSRRRSNSMEIDDQHQESDSSNDENASQATTVSNPPPPERQKQWNGHSNGGSTTDDSLFKHPTDLPGTRARRSRSSTRKNKTTYADESESDGDAPRSQSPSPRARRKGAKKTEHAHDPQDSLFNILKEETELDSIIKTWIDKYKQNREEAVTVLLRFFVNSSGNESEITPQMLQSMEMKDIVDKIILDSDDNNKECPLISTRAMWKEFQPNFVNFINILIHKCENSIIYDDYLLMTLKDFVTTLSDSKIRALRHTATVAALKILTALTEVISTLAENLREAQYQLDSWEQKSRERVTAAAGIIRTLLTKRNEFKANSHKIHSTIHSLLKSIFSQRCRDTFPKIRLMCIEEYKIWVDKLPKIFCLDDYLNAIGLSLLDEISEIRLKSLKVLQSLYGSERLQQSLVNFNDKFKNRIVKMTLDKDINVSIECVKLLTIIQRNHPEILNDNDHDHIYELLYASNRSLALASGEFLREMLTPVDEVRDVRTRDDRRSLNTSIIRDFVQFFIESELPDHCDYLIDALIDNNEVMQDWQCMTDLLLQVPETEEEALTENEEMGLIKIMVSCIKQASTGLPPLGRVKKALSGRVQKQVAAAKEKLTAHFITTLIDLLRKYHNDADLLGMLLTIPQYFDLNICVRDPRSLRIWLNEIKDIVDDTSDKKVLENSSLALHYFCDQSHSETSQFKAQRDRIIDSMCTRCKRSIDDYTTLITCGETTDQEALDKGIVSLKKIAVFYAHHNMNEFNLWNSFKAILESAKDSLSDVPNEAIECSLQACYFSLIWDKQTLKSDLGKKGEAIVVSLKENLDTFMNILRYFMDVGENVSDTIRKKSYTITCDLLVIFSKSLRFEENELLHKIVYEPDSEIGDMLNAYVQEHVFIDEDSRNEELNFERRNLLMAFGRVIMFDVFPVRLAAHVFQNYVKHYNNYGDIIKMILIRAREIDGVNCALTMQFSLSKLFDEVFEEKEGKLNDYDIKSIKELAKSFQLSFGFDTEKSREEIFILHLGGLDFIATTRKDSNGIPINLLYFNVLIEFSSKLVLEDKKQILKLLNQKLPVPRSSCDDAWEPLMKYRQSLLDGKADETENTGKSTPSRRSRNQSKGESKPEGSDRCSDHDDGSKQMYQGKNKNKGRKKTLKRTPLTTAKTRKAPKASTPGDANLFTESFHNVPQNVQRELEEMDINLTHQGKPNASQQSHMEVNSE